MQINDLVSTNLGELSDDDLTERLIQLSRPIKTKKSISGSSIGKVKSNKDKQLEDMLSKLNPEQLKAFQNLLKGA